MCIRHEGGHPSVPPKGCAGEQKVGGQTGD